MNIAICKLCGKEFEQTHFNQKYCSDECKTIAKKQVKQRYKKSQKGQEALKRWHESERFKENEKRYRAKPEAKRKAVLRVKKYLESHPEEREKNRLRTIEYGKSEKGREANRKAVKKYRQTEKGKLTSRYNKYNHRAEGKIDKDFLIELLKGDTCYYCGKKIEGKKTIDHKTPVSRGGTNASDNVVLCCVHCNVQKHDKTESEYKEWLKNENNL